MTALTAAPLAPLLDRLFADAEAAEPDIDVPLQRLADRDGQGCRRRWRRRPALAERIGQVSQPNHNQQGGGRSPGLPRRCLPCAPARLPGRVSFDRGSFDGGPVGYLIHDKVHEQALTEGKPIPGGNPGCT